MYSRIERWLVISINILLKFELFVSTDLEWKIIYVGSAEDPNYDQVLEEVFVGPVPIGINKFVLQANAPEYRNIKNEDLIGVTVALVTCSYIEQEFVRIGYFVNNEYNEPYDLENPPNPVDINKLFRNILANEPRVTRFAIDWSGNSPQLPVVSTSEESVEEIVDVDNEMDLQQDDALEEEDDDDDDDDEDDDPNREYDLEDEMDEDKALEDDEDEDEGETDNCDELVENAEDLVVGTTLHVNEDSMDVGMMQYHASDSNMSNQGIF